MDVARRVVKNAATADADTQLSLDEKVARAYPPVLKEMPAERRVVIVGPKGLRVRDVVKMREAKVGPNVILARVRASKEPYKSFDADELGVLKKLVAEKKKASAGSGEMVQTKDGPLDVATSCAKRLAATQLCEQIPFPGSSICKSGIDGEFPCPK